MATNGTASILTIVGGIFYVIGGAVVALIVGSLSSLSGGLGGFGFNTCSILAQVGSSCGSSSTSSGSIGALGGSGIDSLGYAVAGFGILVGILIVVGGFLFRSELPGRRKIGGIVVVVMMLIGGIATLGGLLIGFILVAIGAYLGLTYKAKSSGMTFGLGPIGSVTLGSNSGPNSQRAISTGTGPTNYCIKCGSQLRPGAIFCQACGERV